MAERGTIGKATFEQVTALVDEGMTRSAAFAKVAEETERTPATVATAFYRVAREMPDGGGVQQRPRKKRVARRCAGDTEARPRPAAARACDRRGRAARGRRTAPSTRSAHTCARSTRRCATCARTARASTRSAACSADPARQASASMSELCVSATTRIARAIAVKPSAAVLRSRIASMSNGSWAIECAAPSMVARACPRPAARRSSALPAGCTVT